MTSPAGIYVLMVMNGPDDGRVFEINKERTSIGNSEEDDIIIYSDPTLNTTHALLVRDKNQFKLVKNQSSGSSNLLIQPGKCFTIGETELLIKPKYQV